MTKKTFYGIFYIDKDNSFFIIDKYCLLFSLKNSLSLWCNMFYDEKRDR
jgi:hypothetical protein